MIVLAAMLHSASLAAMIVGTCLTARSSRPGVAIVELMSTVIMLVVAFNVLISQLVEVQLACVALLVLLAMASAAHKRMTGAAQSAGRSAVVPIEVGWIIMAGLGLSHLSGKSAGVLAQGHEHFAMVSGLPWAFAVGALVHAAIAIHAVLQPPEGGGRQWTSLCHNLSPATMAAAVVAHSYA